jgi:CheY-like chemotaxis protein
MPGIKLPAGKTATLKCPKCQSVIPVTAASFQSKAKETAAGAMNSVMGETYNSAEKPFDFLDENAQTAIICEPNIKARKILIKTLNHMDYYVTEAKDGRDALRKMRYHNYNVVIFNEQFDSEDPDANGVLAYLQQLPMDQRREVFIILISARFRTMDNMMAFNKSVNLIVNLKNLDMFNKILRQNLVEFHRNYRLYRDCARTSYVGAGQGSRP